MKSKEVQEQLGEQRFKSQKMQDEAHKNAGGVCGFFMKIIVSSFFPGHLYEFMSNI